MRKWLLFLLTILFSFCLNLFSATERPDPVPPIDDDDPLFLLPSDVEIIGKALRGLVQIADQERLFQEGGVLLEAHTRRWSTETVRKWTVDFVFSMGGAFEPGSWWYRVVRYEYLEDEEGVSASYTLSDRLLFHPKAPPSASLCLAPSSDALLALAAAFKDPEVISVLKQKLPTYLCTSVITKAGGYEESRILSVAFNLVNQQDQAQKEVWAVEVELQKDGGRPLVRILGTGN